MCGILIAAAAIMLLFAIVFVWFQRYIVYTPDGIRLDVPFLRGILDEIPPEARREPFPRSRQNEGLPREIDENAQTNAASLDSAPLWLNPNDRAAQVYVTDLAIELVRLGFDEILLVNFYPPNDADFAVIDGFIEELRQILSAYGAVLRIEGE